MLIRIFHLQVSDGCVDKLTTVDVVIKNTVESTLDLCDTTCKECKRLNDSICDECTRLELTYPIPYDPKLRKTCLGKCILLCVRFRQSGLGLSLNVKIACPQTKWF